MPSPTKAATTFVQTDKDTFRDLVQKLTGLNPDEPNRSTPPSKLSATRRSPFKLHQRRHAMRNKIEIKLGLINSPRHGQTFISSPVTPLGSELSVFFSGGVRDDDRSADTPQEVEERSLAVAEKMGLCLQTLPVTTPRGSETPELLPLFPLTSPKETLR